MVTFLTIIRYVCDILTIIILLRVIVSWYTRSQTNALFRLLCWLTDPILAPIRRVVPRLGPFDFSPLVAIILLQLIRYLSLYLLL